MTQEELYEALKVGDEERTRLMAVQTEILKANGEIIVRFMNMFAPSRPLSQDEAEEHKAREEKDRLSNKRDMFAACALEGICAHQDTWGLQDEEIVERVYGLADLMIAERAK